MQNGRIAVPFSGNFLFLCSPPRRGTQKKELPDTDNSPK